MGNVFDVLRALPSEQIFSCDRLILSGDNRGFSCGCWSLQRPQALSLPQGSQKPHAGLILMAATCEAWSRERFSGRAPYRLKLEPGRVAISDYIEWDLQKNYLSTWPIPIENSTSEIWLVLREWVRIADDQSEQREKYARHLQTHPRWQQAIDMIKPAIQPLSSPFAYQATEGESMEEYPSDQVVVSSVRSSLQSSGLPTTPSIIEYALSEAGYPYLHHGVGPAAEVLVESLCLVDTSLRPQRGEVISSITGSSLARNKPLWDAAYRTMAQHQDWWTSTFETLAVDLRIFSSPNQALEAGAQAEINGTISRLQNYEREKERTRDELGRELSEQENKKAEARVRQAVSRQKRK